MKFLIWYCTGNKCTVTTLFAALNSGSIELLRELAKSTFKGELTVKISGVMRGSRGGRPPRVQVKKGAKNELTGIYFDIFWGSNGPQKGAKLGFRCDFVSDCGKGAPNCDA